MPGSRDNIHDGHRARMRERFSTHGSRVFHTYELLEMLLYHIIPYKNTNPHAKNLMARFHTLDGVLSASREELMSVEGVGEKIADAIIALGALDIRSPKLAAGESLPVFQSYKQTGEYLVEYFKAFRTYTVVALFLNSKMELLGIEQLYTMDFSSGGVRSDRFIEAGVRAGAAVMIVAHNHPYGPMFPNEGDITTNNMIAGDLLGAGITLAEHYLISGSLFVGFMSNSPSAAFSQSSAVAAFLRSKEGYDAENT